MYGRGRDLIQTAHLTPTPKGSCIQWTPQAVELVLVLPDDNSHGTEKSAAKGWESAPWGGAIENGQHERKDRACKIVSCFAHTRTSWRTTGPAAHHGDLAEPHCASIEEQERICHSLRGGPSSDDGILVSTRVSRGRSVAIGRIRSTLRDRPPFCDGYCSAQKTG